MVGSGQPLLFLLMIGSAERTMFDISLDVVLLLRKRFSVQNDGSLLPLREGVLLCFPPRNISFVSSKRSGWRPFVWRLLLAASFTGDWKAEVREHRRVNHRPKSSKINCSHYGTSILLVSLSSWTQEPLKNSLPENEVVREGEGNVFHSAHVLVYPC